MRVKSLRSDGPYFQADCIDADSRSSVRPDVETDVQCDLCVFDPADCSAVDSADVDAAVVETGNVCDVDADLQDSGRSSVAPGLRNPQSRRDGLPEDDPKVGAPLLQKDAVWMLPLTTPRGPFRLSN